MPGAPGDTVFRQAIWVNLVAAVVSVLLTVGFLLGPIAAPWFGQSLGAMGLLNYFVGACFGLFAWLTCRALKMARAPTNWVMRLAPNGIYLRYRSYLNGDFPGEPVAAFIPSGAIAWTGPVIEKGSRIDSDGDRVAVTHRRLEIKLRDPGLDDLKQQIAHERKRRIPSRFGSKGVFRHYPVRVVGDDVIQIDWRDAQTSTRPGLKAAAAILARRYPSREAEHRERPDADGLDRRGQENQIIALVEAGDIIQAVKLTKRLYGLSTTDARAFIDDLTG